MPYKPYTPYTNVGIKKDTREVRECLSGWVGIKIDTRDEGGYGGVAGRVYPSPKLREQ